MSIEQFANYEATIRILKALLNCDEDISCVASEWKFLTTKITNQISALRKSGIDIETKTVKIPDTNKYYGRYTLIQDEDNINRAISLLEKIEEKLS